MTGAPTFIAVSMILTILFACISPRLPPKTVKSCEKTKTVRPSIVPWPVTTPSPGIRYARAAAIGLIALALVALSVNPASVAAVDPDEYSIAKIFYGSGWMADPTSGLRRYVALLNLTEGYQ